MKNLILSIDPFEDNHNVLKAGLELAKKIQLKLTLHSALYITSPAISQPLGNPATTSTAVASVNGQLSIEAQEKMEEIVEVLKAKWPLVSSQVEIGFKSDKIIEKESMENAYMILLTRRNHNDWIGELFGTSETKIAQSTECPVMIFPPIYQFSHFKNILYILQPQVDYAEHIKVLRQLSTESEGQITAVIVSSEQDDDFDYAAVLREAGVEDVTLINFEDVDSTYEALRLFEQTDIDLFAFPDREKSFFERMFDQDNSKRIILEAHIPILVF